MTFVIPGQCIGAGENLECGLGTYCRDNRIFASLAGFVSISQTVEGQKSTIIVTSNMVSETASVLSVLDKVMCRVLKITINNASVEILSVRDQELMPKPKGIIRREDVRLSEMDSLVMSECFRPGDILLASIISLGDSRQYYLSTATADLGVCWAKSNSSGGMLVPLSWKVILVNSLCDCFFFSRFHCTIGNGGCRYECERE